MLYLGELPYLGAGALCGGAFLREKRGVGCLIERRAFPLQEG